MCLTFEKLRIPHKDITYLLHDTISYILNDFEKPTLDGKSDDYVPISDDEIEENNNENPVDARRYALQTFMSELMFN